MTHPIINVLKTEWGYLGKRRRLFIFYIILFVIAGGIGLITPYLIGDIFNSIQQTISSMEELRSLILKISFLLFLEIGFWIFHGPARILEQTTGFFVKNNYINDKIRMVLKLPVKWQKDNHSGDTIDKINRASGALQEFSSHVTFSLVYTLTSFIGSIIILFFIDWKIGLFAFAFSALILLIIAKVDKYLHKRYLELNLYNNKLSATIFDYISNIFTVITLRLKRTVVKEINAKQEVCYPVYRKTAIVNEIKWGFASLAVKLMVVLALIYYAFNEFSITGTILIGTLYMLYGYLDNVGNTFYKFADLYGHLIGTNAKIVGASSLDEEYNKLKYPEIGRLPDKWKELSFNNLSFTYDVKGKRSHLEDLNFKIKRKQKIALVGESGSGKSTLLSLIRGLYEIEKGEIYCDGKLLSGGINRIKDHVTLIPQEPEIFNNSFRYNITMGFPTTTERLNKAISIAQLNSVIAKLPNGLDTSVMEKGVSLSGGEKQRLALARGLLAAKDSEIILLDEPTSSVDSLNEMKIHECLFKEFQNKVIISSIHRLHLLNKFDYIYLFSKGKIVGQGTFEEIQKNPLFDSIWKKYNLEKK